MQQQRYSARIFSILMVCTLAASPVQAEEVSLVSKIKLVFWGISIGKMDNSIKVSDTNYSIAGTVKTSGIAALFSKTRANFVSAGKIKGKRLVPKAHDMKYKSNRKKGSLRFAFLNGNISQSNALPKVKYKPDAIPVKPQHLNKVLDPVSALLFPVKTTNVGDGKGVCNRTLPIFDGKSRLNLVFSYQSQALRKTKGFQGMTFTCSVRYQPVSGFRPSRKNIKFMKANRNMSVTMARVGKSNLYALFGFKVKTSKGMASGIASKFFAN